MPAYQYDPGGSFRGWLRRLCHHRAIDLFAKRAHADLIRSMTTCSSTKIAFDRGGADHGLEDAETAAERLLLLREAQAVQEEVRRRVKPIRWEIFWRVVIEGEPMSEAAATLGLKYATAYAAARHVAKLLREEGRRHTLRLGLDDSVTP